MSALIKCPKCEHFGLILDNYGGLLTDGVLSDTLKNAIKDHEEYHLKQEEERLKEIQKYWTKKENLFKLKQNLNNFSSIEWKITND